MFYLWFHFLHLPAPLPGQQSFDLTNNRQLNERDRRRDTLTKTRDFLGRRFSASTAAAATLLQLCLEFIDLKDMGTVHVVEAWRLTDARGTAAHLLQQRVIPALAIRVSFFTLFQA